LYFQKTVGWDTKKHNRYCVKKDKVNQTFLFLGGIEFILNRIQTFTCWSWNSFRNNFDSWSSFWEL